MLLLEREILGTKTVYSKDLITKKTKKAEKKPNSSRNRFLHYYKILLTTIETLLEYNIRSKIFFALIHKTYKINGVISVARRLEHKMWHLFPHQSY